MLVIIGYVVIVGAVFGGFALAGGHLIVMNKKAEDAATHDGGTLDVEQPEDINPELLDAGNAKQ